MHIDTSFLESMPFLVPEWDHIEFMLVGCGGTGSHTAYAIARLMYAINNAGKRASATFVDFDTVEQKNITRQLFCPADLGRSKAEVLAYRLSLSLGLNIDAIRNSFNIDMLDIKPRRQSTITVIVGCVDNSQARVSLAKSLTLNPPDSVRRIIWLDGGNHEKSGQVLLGNISSEEELQYAFPRNSDFCVGLPSPVLLHPELLLDEKKSSFQNLSCAEQINAQSLSINLRVAAEINDYLIGIVFGGLRKFATYFDLPSGSCRSTYITKSNILK